ncbi:MAG: GNAT family N-acetyltransferase [Gemmatimonadetes bacterium]|nr:GNAT family N-acetyltransferase [Gemmatimonadota bacterium]
MRVEEYSPRWQTEVGALTDKVLGAGFFESPSEITRNAEVCVYICVTEDDEVVGFVRGELLPKDGLRPFLEQKLADIPEDLDEADANGVLGVIQTVVVAPEHQGKGIGTKLLRIVHDKIIGRGADKLIVTFKRGPTSAQVGWLMENLGFEFWAQLETYWKMRCDLGDFACVDRGDACRCEAVFYRKRVF